jgi:phage internal scaffolding protein
MAKEKSESQKPKSYREQLGHIAYEDPGIDCQHPDAQRTNMPAKQEFKDECDINNIVASYFDGDMPTHLSTLQAGYGDFTKIQDYAQAQNLIKDAQNAFNAYPAEIRKRFNNDPGEMIKFLEDNKNNKEAVELGLKTAREQNKAEQTLKQIRDEIRDLRNQTAGKDNLPDGKRESKTPAAPKST